MNRPPRSTPRGRHAARRPARPILEPLEARQLLASVVATPPRNVIIFVADGLRAGSVNPTDAPTLYALRQQGVNFSNSHALFPTFTTPNASAIATGHYLGDTGDFSNTVYSGYPIFNGTNGTVTPFLENDAVLGDVDEHFGGNYLDEETLLAYARGQGYDTAAVGKQGPVLIQDVTQGNPNAPGGTVPAPQTVILDDSTGNGGSVPLSPKIQAALQAAGLPLNTPARGANAPSGNNTTPGTTTANLVQQQYFADATTKALLPSFQQDGKSFAMVFWSRDPDGSQHNQGDSLNSLTPGINGPTSRAAIHNADNNLKQILDYINADPALKANTDIFVTADHGFSTISKNAADASGGTISDYASSLSYPGVNAGFLPVGFVAIDVAHALNQPLFDPDSPVAVASGRPTQYTPVTPGTGTRPRPANGDGLIGGTGAILPSGTDASVVVAANGGSDLIYVPNGTLAQRKAIVQQVVDFLSSQQYTSGLFVDDAFGAISGTLPLSAINLVGSSQLPTPAIVLNFKTFSVDPSNPLQTGVEIADSGLQQGQGMHGSFGREDTFNNMAAIGPDFKAGYNDTAPISNADVAITLAHALGFNLPANGNLSGRVLSEALAGGPATVYSTSGVLASPAANQGQRTYLNYQQVGNVRYFDAAGYAGRTVGLNVAVSGGTLSATAAVPTVQAGPGAVTLLGFSGRSTLVSGTGADTFVLSATNGTATIVGFDPAKGDTLALAGGLTRAQLSVVAGTGANAGNTLIFQARTGKLLAVLQNYSAGNLTDGAFTTYRPVIIAQTAADAKKGVLAS